MPKIPSPTHAIQVQLQDSRPYSATFPGQRDDRLLAFRSEILGGREVEILRQLLRDRAPPRDRFRFLRFFSMEACTSNQSNPPWVQNVRLRPL